jgi:hypothetical protein
MNAATPVRAHLAEAGLRPKCQQLTRWGRCQQDAAEQGRCGFHERWSARQDEPDRYLHRKIVLGLTQPVDAYLTEAQIRTTLVGTRHEDGRALDQFVLPDVVESYQTITGERAPKRSTVRWTSR